MSENRRKRRYSPTDQPLPIRFGRYFHDSRLSPERGDAVDAKPEDDSEESGFRSPSPPSSPGDDSDSNRSTSGEQDASAAAQDIREESDWEEEDCHQRSLTSDSRGEQNQRFIDGESPKPEVEQEGMYPFAAAGGDDYDDDCDPDAVPDYEREGPKDWYLSNSPRDKYAKPDSPSDDDEDDLAYGGLSPTHRRSRAFLFLAHCDHCGNQGHRRDQCTAKKCDQCSLYHVYYSQCPLIREGTYCILCGAAGHGGLDCHLHPRNCSPNDRLP